MPDYVVCAIIAAIIREGYDIQMAVEQRPEPVQLEMEYALEQAHCYLMDAREYFGVPEPD
jgi:hypothetical protein